MSPIDPKPITPEGANTPSERESLANDMAQWIRAWETKRKVIEPKWDRIDKQIDSIPEAPQELPWPGFVYRNIPLLAGKSKAWEAYVCNAPCSTTPYLIGTVFGKDSSRAKTVESDFYLFMRKGQWARQFKKVTHATGAYGKGIWRVTLEKDSLDRISFKYENVPMRKFFIYPDIPEGITEAKACGHTFELRVTQVKELQDQGYLWPDVEVTGQTEIPNSPTPNTAIDNKNTIAKFPEDFPVPMAEVFFKYKFGSDQYEKWYRAWIATKEKKLLAIWNYEYSRPWYFAQFLNEEEDSFLPSTSLFNSVQDLQLAVNDQWNFMSAGSQMGAFPTMFSSGWALPQKYAKTKPGQVVPITGGGKVDQLTSRFDPTVMPVLLNDIRKQASEMFRLDEQQMGVRTSGDQTATAAQIRQGGTQVAITDDLSNIDVCMGEMGAFMQELYRIHYPDFFESYGDSLATQPDEGVEERGYPAILDKPVLWELLGRSPFNTPLAQSQSAMQLAQTLAAVANPENMQVLLALGVNVGAIIQEIVSNSTLENRNAILVNPAYSGEDPQQTWQALEGIMQKIGAMNQQAPQPKPPSESMNYKDASPFIQAQMEAREGYNPDPAHEQGLPHPGSDGHKNLMEHLQQVKQAQKEQNPPEEGGAPVPAGPQPQGPPASGAAPILRQ